MALFVNGLFNNLSYVVMLSAAKEVLQVDGGVAYVLLSDDCPALVAQILSSLLLYNVGYKARILGITLTTMGSLMLVGFFHAIHSSSIFLPLMAVALTSICFGVGESTFFSLLAAHPSSSISSFSSGTGLAGVVGAGLYYVLVAFLKPQFTMFVIACLVPLHAFAFFGWVLPSKYSQKAREQKKVKSVADALPTLSGERKLGLFLGMRSTLESMRSAGKRLLRRLPILLRYFAPLYSMYVITFFINHAILPHFVVNGESLYVGLFFAYQCAVFITRSSLSLFEARSVITIWVWNACQALLCCIFLVLPPTLDGLTVPYAHLYGLSVCTGAISGLVYVNTFNLLRHDSDAGSDRQMIMSYVVCATTAGPITSAVMGIVLENCLQSWFRPLTPSMMEMNNSHAVQNESGDILIDKQMHKFINAGAGDLDLIAYQ